MARPARPARRKVSKKRAKKLFQFLKNVSWPTYWQYCSILFNSYVTCHTARFIRKNFVCHGGPKIHTEGFGWVTRTAADWLGRNTKIFVCHTGDPNPTNG